MSGQEIKQEISLFSPDEIWIMTDFEISRGSGDSNTVLWEEANRNGSIYAIVLDMPANNYAIQLTMDGIERTIKSASIAEMVAMGYDVPDPVLPFIRKSDDTTPKYVWSWIPRDDRNARFVNSARLSVPAGVAVTGKVLYLVKPK